MKVRICPDCDTHNPEDAWSCANCGYTLSINTLVDIDQEQGMPSQGETEKDTVQDLKEVVLFRSEDSLITNRKAMISGEVFRIDRITSVEKVGPGARSRSQVSEGERRPRPEDILFGLGLAARAIRSLTGIGEELYVLRIHLKYGRVHEYVSKSEERVDSMLEALTKVVIRER